LSFDEPKRDEARLGDIKVSTLDPSKAKRELNWEATYDLQKGLLETVDWYMITRGLVAPLRTGPDEIPLLTREAR